MYNLLKEHGLQDLYRVLEDSLEPSEQDFDTEQQLIEFEKKYDRGYTLSTSSVVKPT